MKKIMILAFMILGSLSLFSAPITYDIICDWDFPNEVCYEVYGPGYRIVHYGEFKDIVVVEQALPYSNCSNQSLYSNNIFIYNNLNDHTVGIGYKDINSCEEAPNSSQRRVWKYDTSLTFNTFNSWLQAVSGN